MPLQVEAHGLVFHQFFQVNLGNDQVQQIQSIVFLGMLILSLYLTYLAFELDYLFRRIAIWLLCLVFGALFGRSGPKRASACAALIVYAAIISPNASMCRAAFILR